LLVTIFLCAKHPRELSAAADARLSASLAEPLVHRRWSRPGHVRDAFRRVTFGEQPKHPPFRLVQAIEIDSGARHWLVKRSGHRGIMRQVLPSGLPQISWDLRAKSLTAPNAAVQSGSAYDNGANGRLGSRS
jgi:hypothetical protein